MRSAVLVLLLAMTTGLVGCQSSESVIPAMSSEQQRQELLAAEASVATEETAHRASNQ